MNRSPAGPSGRSEFFRSHRVRRGLGEYRFGVRQGAVGGRAYVGPPRVPLACTAEDGVGADSRRAVGRRGVSIRPPVRFDGGGRSRRWPTWKRASRWCTMARRTIDGGMGRKRESTVRWAGSVIVHPRRAVAARTCGRRTSVEVSGTRGRRVQAPRRALLDRRAGGRAERADRRTRGAITQSDRVRFRCRIRGDAARDRTEASRTRSIGIPRASRARGTSVADRRRETEPISHPLQRANDSNGRQGVWLDFPRGKRAKTRRRETYLPTGRVLVHPLKRMRASSARNDAVRSIRIGQRRRAEGAAGMRTSVVRPTGRASGMRRVGHRCAAADAGVRR